MRFASRILLCVVFLLSASSAWALVGVGIGLHGGMDMTTIDSKEYSFKLPGDDAGWTESKLVREESEQPYNFGIDLTVNTLPFIDFMVTADFAAARYDVSFEPPEISGQPTVSKTITYNRIAADVTVLYKLIQMPPMLKTFTVYLGAGLGMHYYLPIFTEQTVRDNINSASEDVDLEDIAADTESKFGLHFLAGLKFKPPVIPFAVNVRAKYYIVPDQAEDTPDSYLNFTGGLSFEL